jgi:glycosyltransferase involved in cell wall biosynthesis
MHIFLNGLAASSGAGLTYLHNVVPQLAETSGVRTTLAVQPSLRTNFDGLNNVELFSPRYMGNAARRFWFEQRTLPAIIEESGADVLISAGNFALHKSPVPQILLSGNSLYTSETFYRDVWSRRKYSILIDTFARGLLAKKSVEWADCTVAPSKAFANDLRRWTGKDVTVVHHGFDYARFCRGEKSLPINIETQLRSSEGCLRLLFVSHYNYYRNFETLLRALPLAKKKLPQRKIKLFLTCKLELKANPGAYDPSFAARLVRELGIQENVEELGSVPYELLHHLYSACDLYVTAAYAETFAHPLVEAMASGLPIVASDLSVHREVCGEAGFYFPPFSSESLAESIVSVANNANMRSKLIEAGRQRVTEFSWSRHVASLLRISEELRRARTQLVRRWVSNPVSNYR